MPKTAKTKRNLSTPKVVAVAIKLLERDGIHALTMRSLAESLGIKAASLYNHFPSKTFLLNAVQEEILSHFTPSKRLSPWQDHLRDLATSMRVGLKKYSYAIPLFANRPALSPTAFAQANTTFTVLREAGFSPTQTAFLYQSIAVFVFGHAQAEVGKVISKDGEDDKPDFSKMDLTPYPMLREMGPKVRWEDFDTWFEIGLETIISGMETLLGSSKKTTSKRS